VNLSELASFVCGKARQRDASSLVKCKEFLSRRYELIYNESLWRDSLWTLDFTFTPEVLGVPESWDGIKFMPSVVDRLVALRVTDQPLSVVADEQLYRSSIDEFTQEGAPARYSTGAPVVCILPTTYDTTDIAIVPHDAADVGRTWKMTLIDTSGNRLQYEGTLDAGEVISEAVRVVERCTVAECDEYVSLDSRFGDETIATCPAGETIFPARLPVRLVPKPTAATAFKALVKKKCLALTNDADVPELRGVENILIPLAHGDMMQRARQYGKAEKLHGEGLEMLKEFKTRHVFQETQQMQIVPDVDEVSGAVGIGGNSKGWWS
jgi:hypothetical protein